MRSRLGLLVIVALLASCSSSHPTHSPVPSGDVARARLLVLTRADTPRGWTSSAHKSDPVSQREDAKLAACIGGPDPAKRVTADVFGDVFGQGAQTITTEVVFLRTTVDAKSSIDALRGAKALPCARAAVRPVLTEQLRLQGFKATIRSIAVTKRTFVVAGFVSAFRVVVRLVASGSSISIQEDVVVLAHGRAQLRATFFDVGVPFASALEAALVKKLSSKLLAA